MVKQEIQMGNSFSQQVSFPLRKNQVGPDTLTESKINEVEEHWLQSWIRKVLRSIPFQIFITILTVWSLFADDIRIIAFEKDADPVFDGITITLIVIFTVEIALSWYVLEEYACSFFFFLDLISTISLIFDISMFTELIYNSDGNTASFSRIAAQSRTTRAATRAVRIVKLFRIIRIIKLYKTAMKAQEIKEDEKRQEEKKNKMMLNKRNKQYMDGEDYYKKEKYNILNAYGVSGEPLKGKYDLGGTDQFSKRPSKQPPLAKAEQTQQENKQQELKQDMESVEQDVFNPDYLEEINEKQSKISKVLSNMTLKKVIVVVLLIMFIVPLFDAEIYLSTDLSWNYHVNNIHRLLNLDPSTVTTPQIEQVVQNAIDEHTNLENPLYYFSSPFNELPFFKHTNFDNIRLSDVGSSQQKIDQSALMTARGLTLRADLESVEQGVFLAIINERNYNRSESYLSIGKTIYVVLVLLGMLHFFSKDIDELIVNPIEEMMKKVVGMARDPQSASKEDITLNARYETTIVSNAIIKIGALLSVVYGSAGAQIIGKNMLQQGDMNPMVQGRKKCAIFGFCDIRGFNQVTEVLEEDILLFVNKIGSLVHQAVHRYGGSANKNIGEAFLMVWKIPQEKYQLDHKTNKIQWLDKRYLAVLSDFSILAFVKAIVKINKDPTVLGYRQQPKITKKLPDFKVEMGFGLHIGWAIEGAIGSQYKIDASYLSPNVNMASRCVAATRQFGVNYLVSEDLYDLLTTEMKQFCRNIDRVTVKGSKKPIRLYTIDLNVANISPGRNKLEKYPNPADMIDVQTKRTINMQYLKEDQIHKYNALAFVKRKKQLREVMIHAVSDTFKRRFGEGIRKYYEGDWKQSKKHFEYALKIRDKDGPTLRLLSYMGNFKYEAPSDWNQYRELTSK